MFGVSMVDPKHPKCEKPRSSNKMMTTFGASSPGCGGMSNDGVDSASVRPIVPLNSIRLVST